MAGKAVRIYVGTRKGAYVAEGDEKRRKWKVRGPYQEGMDVYHVQPDPRHDGVVYSAANSVWWGPALYRSTDFGKKWKEIAPPQMTVTAERPPPSPDADPRNTARPIVNLWHVEPGPEGEPSTVYVGVDPGSAYRSTDSGKSWVPLDGLNHHETREKWNPGAGGLCMHTILVDSRVPGRMYAGISAAGTFRSDDDGEHWRPMNHGVQVGFQPDKNPPFGQCVHKIALDSADPSTIYRQDHDGIHVTHDAMEHWTRVGKVLGDDFGFVVTSPATRPGTAYFAPLKGDARIMKDGHLQVLRWSEKSRKFSPTVPAKKYPGSFGTHREGLASDTLDPPGIYLGTTTGDLFVSPDEAKNWELVPFRFPAIHSVEVAVAPGRK
jgi:hypothetical protein